MSQANSDAIGWCHFSSSRPTPEFVPKS